MRKKKAEPKRQTLITTIDGLNEKAWKLRVADSTQAFELSSEALRLSEKIQYQKGKAEGLRTFGFCHIRIAQYQEALSLLNQAYQLFVSFKDIRNQAVIHEYYGIIYRSFGNYAASLEELYKALTLSREANFQEEETLSLYHLSITYKYLGDLNNALEHALQGLPIARAIQEIMPESYHLNCIGGVYAEMGRFEEALDYYQQSLVLRQTIGDLWGVAGCYDNLGNIYLQQGKYQEALDHCLQSLAITEKTGDQKGRGNTLFNTGRIYAEWQDYANALHYLQRSLQIREAVGDKKGRAEIYCFLGALYEGSAFAQANLQQSLECLQQALTLAEEIQAKDILYKIHHNLSKTYKHAGDLALALLHYEKYAELEKEVNNETVQQRILNMQITHQVAQSQKESEIFRLKNVELAQLVEEVNQQKAQIEQALEHLKATQAQLIQSEKLASLGELTAGIAHEIQNPLNFVNNFSELNTELIDELTEELEQGNKDDAITIAKNIKGNEQKIAHHGQRASSIVKGMLEHSRTNTGVKEPTDLNALADEYLRLAYHGLRAKDNSFNATMETHFDPDLPLVSVIPQDIGRVLLNLINNAFYAVAERSRSTVQQRASVGVTSSHADTMYQPTITVSTQKIDRQILIKVKDNGNGIPEAIKDKIFQPFFTTKPTGQGTGLGLSLSYDIVVKGHGGTLEVESAQSQSTEFLIKFPI
ncbi:ATP-binding region ATPase domain protein [Haliscomenobacter hydrossis DSM 1100]|uniref:histidine kinase n=2 Tax=Haliscomenobacter TaxID=2349 RepID=F4KP80_HALH1|nr:ATP-binding region ATPase domain protein [Haliscomenobacter hydrossis DSM 1100]